MRYVYIKYGEMNKLEYLTIKNALENKKIKKTANFLHWAVVVISVSLSNFLMLLITPILFKLDLEISHFSYWLSILSLNIPMFFLARSHEKDKNNGWNCLKKLDQMYKEGKSFEDAIKEFGLDPK